MFKSRCYIEIMATPKLLTALSWKAHKYLVGAIKVRTTDTITGSEFILYSSSRDQQDGGLPLDFNGWRQV